MEHLVPAEQSVYGDLIEDRYGVAVRLEQERVAFSSLRRALSERPETQHSSFGVASSR
jgi:hypothetical protein